MPEQHGVTQQGRHDAPRRLPLHAGRGHRWPRSAYGKRKISERHRHRYEFNNAYREQLDRARPASLSGLSPDGTLVEMVELADHPWFLGCQFHPEFKSRPLDCHPLFRGFIRAAAAAPAPRRTRRPC